jgi:hypothetical protein
MDQYGDQLRNIAGIIQHAGFLPSVRGEGKVRFVCAEHGGRIVEIYSDGKGFTVELWEQPEELSMFGCEQVEAVMAAGQAIEWLLRHDNAD